MSYKDMFTGNLNPSAMGLEENSPGRQKARPGPGSRPIFVSWKWRITARTVEIFHKDERIAAHQRMSGNRRHATVPEHVTRPVIGATPAGPLSASARMPSRSGWPPQRCAT